MNILILTGRFGMGHYSVAKTLVQEIEKNMPEACIETQDIFTYTTPFIAKTVYSAYTLLMNKGSKIYNFFYKKIETGKKPNIGSSPISFYLPYLLGLDSLIKKNQPDLIISTLPFCSQLVSEYKEKYHSNIPLFTCITDISSHVEWITPETNTYLVASQMTKQELISQGIPEERIIITGIPVREQFKQPIIKSHSAEKHLLIMGGGLGLLPKQDRFYQQLSSLPGVHTTIITGNNLALYNRLYNRFPDLEVIGFTDQVYRYMQEADLIITKPGGITLFETIHSELPILAFTPFLAQEQENAAFIRHYQIGRIMQSAPNNCIEEIAAALYDDNFLAACRENIRYIKDNLPTDALINTLNQITTNPITAPETQKTAGGACA
ncbi:MAG: UDP-diphospho-muramoylpentapeptide beta-N-acetylglucosaminyltransferase [Peptococcaceae bacterium]|jgi:processive 1,2-diacylglycerol beta-glucosyltransferase|nr:UDP-diphospho-muramoylpentapeptide beta-N-acetylglucosaminyltransferase [Peptococcaceae bacterium]